MRDEPDWSDLNPRKLPPTPLQYLGGIAMGVVLTIVVVRLERCGSDLDCLFAPLF
jgi:hypothetical protein